MAKRKQRAPAVLTAQQRRAYFTPQSFQTALHTLMGRWEEEGLSSLDVLYVLLFEAAAGSAHEEIPFDITIEHAREAFEIGVQQHAECLKHEHHEPSAIACAHANEVPNTCPCPPTCYCKTHTCAQGERLVH